MNSNIKIPQNNRYFNKNFKECIQRFLGRQVDFVKFKEINFSYLFNLPFIIEKDNELKIRINEDIDKFKWDKNFLDTVEERKRQIITKLKDEGYNIENFSLVVFWRLIIGLGASHPQETSMTLHHIYGIPYIPGSAIKGVTRHWAVLKFAEKFAGQRNEKGKFDGIIKDVAKALEEGKDLNIAVDGVEFEDLIKIFGTQKRQGEVIFFDAYPTENINLKIDIMNPHYSKYYSGELPPADWQSPLLVKFLTVEDTKFQFYLAAKEEDLLKKASKLLKGALVDHGLGAKTSLGYGLFVETPHS